MKAATPFTTLATLLFLSACNQSADQTGPSPDTAADKSETADQRAQKPPSQPSTDEPVSILRPEITGPEETTQRADAPLEPLEITINFASGGSKLDADAIDALEKALASPQMASGLPITLSAHSDSVGTDEANLDASEERGLAVARWLIDEGIDESRITVIAFGEQNPIAPNALADGSKNEEGRAANRRVEILIDPIIEAGPKSEPGPEPKA